MGPPDQTAYQGIELYWGLILVDMRFVQHFFFQAKEQIATTAAAGLDQGFFICIPTC